MDTALARAGHNSAGITIEVEVRLFNSVGCFGDGTRKQRLAVPAGSTVGDVLRSLGIGAGEVYLALRNGRDVTPSLYGGINTEHVLDDGDVIALSGPVPYSWGYGAPVV